MVQIRSMAEKHSEYTADTHADSGPLARRLKKQTAFGEPLWLDTLKTLGVAAITMLVTILLGGALTLMIIAPWGRASHDCSMWCVFKQKVESWFSDEPS